MTRRHLAFFGLFAPLAMAVLFGVWLSEPGPVAWAGAGLVLLVLAYVIDRIVQRVSLIVDSEQRLRTIFNNAMVGIGRVASDHHWIEVNPALCRMFGMTAEEMRGSTFLEQTHPDDRTISTENFAAVQRGEQSRYTLEKRYMRPDGSVINAMIAAQGIYDEQGKFDCMTVVVEDITLRYEAQRELTRRIGRSSLLLELPRRAEELSEREFMQYALEQAESLTESEISFMHFVNDDGEGIELVAWSRNTLEKYCHASYDSHYPISQAGIWADAARDMMPVVVNDYASAPNKHGLPTGHSELQRLLSVPVIEGGSVRMLTGVGNKASNYSALDIETVQLIANETWRIVRRQRIETALRQATQVVNASPVVCFRCAPGDNWPITFVTENVKQWGYDIADLIHGKLDFVDMVHPDDRAQVADVVDARIAEGVERYEQEYRLITGDDRVIWVIDRTRIGRNGDATVSYFDCVLTDITERKHQQLELAETQHQQQQLNKRLEEANNQLLQSEKMASIGQLAAGIAHELNNPIGFVHSNLGTLDGYLHDLMAIIDVYDKATQQPDCACPQLPMVEHIKEERDFSFLKSDIFSLVAESKEGLGRVRKIVQDLKSFSRVGEQEWQEADLHQGLDSTLNIVWNELKYKCTVVKEYGDIPHIYCLISQLNQVFMNLLVNAGHAIENQGTITIRTRPHGEESVCVEVSDTGKGIAPEHLNRIFEPFFTTKPVGKGTGLGLSLSYSIVQRHHGRIEVDSQPGRGSTFRVVLPIHPPVKETEPS
jgi:PAS domain S-box-containing protein